MAGLAACAGDEQGTQAAPGPGAAVGAATAYPAPGPTTAADPGSDPAVAPPWSPPPVSMPDAFGAAPPAAVDPGAVPAPIAGSLGAMGAPATGPESSAPPAAGPEQSAAASDGLRAVLLVGNGVAGTVSFVDAATFENLGSVDIIPDLEEVLQEIQVDPVRAIAYPLVKNGQLLHHFEPGEGDRFLDDVFVSPDGTVLYVSRSNLGDVAAFDLSKPDHPQLWRRRVDGLKADHATISPDGAHLVVSATTANVADVIDARTGKILSTFPTGDFPHQNDYSADGNSIYNSSIGNVSYNAVSYDQNARKGDRTLVKVNAKTFKVERTWKFEYGIRPNVVTADETTLYTQLSYLNGVVKYDLENSREIARSDQPLSEFAMRTYATYDEYPHDSAHHGLALSADGTRLCDCGTVDNNVAIVRTEDMSVEHVIDVGLVPYWATNDPSGRFCFVSLSGDDAIAVIEYASGQLVTNVTVGRFPQRSRLGRVPEAVVAALNPIAG